MPSVRALSVPDGTRIYSQLKSEVISAGILKRSYGFYLGAVGFAFAGFAASAGAIYLFENLALLLLACLAFSFFSVQVAGVMHDSGHRAIFDSNKLNDYLGYVSALILGMVFDNWRTRHNAHHAYSNQIGKDPDLEIPLVVMSGDLVAQKGALEKSILRHQALYYYPLGMIVSFSNRLGSISYFRHRRLVLADAGRLPAYLIGVMFLFVLPFLIFDPTKALFVFFAVHLSSGVYLANCFAPNHKGRDIVAGDAQLSFVEQQIATSRNVAGGFLTDVALVGLNHQIEHHLFPNCPRNKLRHISPFVREICETRGIEYIETGIIETNRDILRALRTAPRATAEVQPPLLV